ncbi:unnamed protein product [Gordionus sp. m RMFG-2023]
MTHHSLGGSDLVEIIGKDDKVPTNCPPLFCDHWKCKSGLDKDERGHGKSGPDSEPKLKSILILNINKNKLSNKTGTSRVLELFDNISEGD